MRSRRGLAALLVPPMAVARRRLPRRAGGHLRDAFWTTDPFTNLVVRTFTLENFRARSSTPTYLGIVGRTLLIAVLVTVLCIVSRCRSRSSWRGWRRGRLRGLLVAAVLVPLWASYLVKAYAWRAMLSPRGDDSDGRRRRPGFGLARSC